MTGRQETATVAASPEDVWSILEDPAALRRVLPGIESLEADGPDRYRGVLAAKTMFLTVRADVVLALLEPDRPRHVVLDLAGQTRGISGAFTVRAPLDLSPLPDGGTRIDYSVDVDVTGQIANFGRSAGD